MLIHGKIIIIALFIWNIFYQFFHRVPFYSYLDDLLVFWALLYMLALLSKRRYKSEYIKTIVIGVLLYFICIIISITINDVPIIIAFHGSLSLMKPWILLLYFMQLCGRQYNLIINKIIHISVFIGLVNLIVILVMRNIYGTSYDQDYAVGISGDAHVVGEYLFILSAYVYYKIFEEKNYYAILLIFPIIYAFLIVEAKQILVFALIFPLLFLFINTKRKIINSILVILILVLSISNYSHFKNNQYFGAQVSAVEFMVINYENFVDIKAIIELIDFGFKEMEMYFFGAGPGMYGSSIAADYNTYFYSKYLKPLYHPVWFGTITDPQNQIHLVLSEVGVFGIIIFAMLILFIIFHIIKIKLHEMHPDSILLVYIGSGILLHIVGRMIILSSFTMNQSLLYLLFILPIVIMYNNKKQIT